MAFTDVARGNFGDNKFFRIILREAGQSREFGGEDQSQAVSTADSIFLNAISSGASDIHLQPERDKLKIRFRIDGALADGGEIPRDLATNVLARLKLASGMRIDENREPQDGRIDMEHNKRRLSARASCVPCLNGEKFVMRLLDPQAMRTDLQRLGMNEETMKKWLKAVSAPYGLILVTGPTGSGKTSTLYASLHQLDSKVRNIVTVEDPIEYEFDKNVTQVQVNDRVGFPRVMRSFLRQDPDVMMVGEMRDPESLAIGIQAGLTGHLVLSTLHTNSALETVSRMVDMGSERYLIAGVTVAILAQRLVRLNCPRCRKPYRPTADELESLGIDAEMLAKATFAKGEGCPECRGTGFKGRVGIYELILGTSEMKAAIAKGASAEQLEAAAREQGFKSMMEDGREKAMRGWTTADEVIRAVFTEAMD